MTTSSVNDAHHGLINSAVWIVVLNWNGRADTMELLATLTRERATILVVDNASTDGTLAAVTDQFPTVRTLQTGSNLGYAGGNNAGIDFAMAGGAEVIAVLNNDTLVEAGFLAPLVEALADGQPRAVSPDIRYADTPTLSWFRGGTLDRKHGWPRHLTAEEQPLAASVACSSTILTGCCLVASADTWRLVGTFDERFFLIFEDSDWSRRAAGLGVQLQVLPTAHIRHKVSQSFTGQAATLGTYYYARNGLIFAWRHLGPIGALRFFIHRLLRPSLRQVRHREGAGGLLMQLFGVVAACTGMRGSAGLLVTWCATRPTSRKAASHA